MLLYYEATRDVRSMAFYMSKDEHFLRLGNNHVWPLKLAFSASTNWQTRQIKGRSTEGCAVVYSSAWCSSWELGFAATSIITTTPPSSLPLRLSPVIHHRFSMLSSDSS